ncbi:hypothetical protein ATANTOWER_028609 [Ataeniobius toweri]|uniref:Uncharacterized protein n=1 Tax=Ataeniobius toweri TaxID=208326 RepID=A0ABU7BBZ3_9TELE|nr:hypothetical protein [Ataeniobius toweri]
MPTPARRLSPKATPEWKSVQPLSRRLVPEPCIEVSPTISSRNLSTSHTNSGSFPTREETFYVPRASFCSQGSDHQRFVVLFVIFLKGLYTVQLRKSYSEGKNFIVFCVPSSLSLEQ